MMSVLQGLTKALYFPGGSAVQYMYMYVRTLKEEDEEHGKYVFLVQELLQCCMEISFLSRRISSLTLSPLMSSVITIKQATNYVYMHMYMYLHGIQGC